MPMILSGETLILLLLSAGKITHYCFILLTQIRNVIINISYKNDASSSVHFHKLARIHWNSEPHWSHPHDEPVPRSMFQMNLGVVSCCV